MADVTGRYRCSSSIPNTPLLNFDNCILMVGGCIINSLQKRKRLCMQDIIGIGGIIATIVVGIITCIVTWIVAKKSQKIMKLSWNAKSSKVLNTRPQLGKEKMQLLFDGNPIDNPNILQIRIKNTGNSSITMPIIKIRLSSGERLIPFGFMNIPYGYEEKWKYEVAGEKECEIVLEHINPKQEFTAVFFVDAEKFEIEASCPMKDITVKESEFLSEKILNNIEPKDIFSHIVTIIAMLIAMLGAWFATGVAK